MTTTTDRTPVTDLDGDTIDVQARSRDWSEGWPERWDFFQAPSCQCGGYTEWVAEDELRERVHGGWRDGYEPDQWEAWRCTDPDCEQFGHLVEPSADNGCEGPMMNYSYELPASESRGAHKLASLIADLPLCVIDEGGEQWGGTEGYSLALTGGGMDLSWQICEAYTRLGYLPPVAFCDLPAMAGKAGDGLSDGDRYVIAACRRSLALDVERTTWRAGRAHDSLDRIERGD